MGLSSKQVVFVQEYLVDLNATQAAIRAGYSIANADKIGPELLGKTRVAAAIQEAAELPPPGTKRWVIRRKAAVVAAVKAGEITLEEACRRYQLSEEEFLAWLRAFEVHGLPGLRVTRVQRYRDPPLHPSSRPRRPRR